MFDCKPFSCYPFSAAASPAGVCESLQLGEAMGQRGGKIGTFTRREMLRVTGGASAALVLGRDLLGARPALAREGAGHGTAASVAASNRMVWYSLESREQGPLSVGGTKSDYGAEIGSSTYDGEGYV